MDKLKEFRFFPYYLNSRRIADITGERLPLASQTSLNNNSSTRVGAMDATLRASKRLMYSGQVPNLASLVSREIVHDRVLSFVWGVFTFRGASKALDLELKGKPIVNGSFSGSIPLGDREYRMSGQMHNEHYYSDSSITVLTKKRRMFILGHFDFSDEDNVIVSPYLMGELVEDRYFANSLSSSIRVFPDMIDQFARIKEVPLPSKEELRLLEAMPEDDVKQAFADIIGEHYVPKDWGGEKSDLTTTKITLAGQRHPTAFIFKGPSVKGEMHPANMGKRGDQLVRVFDEPVNLVVVQHWNKIANSVVRIAEALAYDPRQPRQYCIIDGLETAHILKAYGRLK
ncbi:hypothetical protein [Allorhizobium terrae]|uniref:Uncharacterized protein n=1 Tax=Allorhizobium terrae TaxID=1848972 RepID=A0A4S3ZYP7_9HYPH|nr:hypothetical protein [Allorhizobium terrae]THF50756.1 hypothetical protein E6C51_07825 [Allorhizobium terrae]